VLLQRKGDNRFVLTSYASREVPEELKTPEELAQHLKLLFKDLGRQRERLRDRDFRPGLPAPDY